MIAALPMYDRAETRTANDHLWQAIRRKLGYGPDALTRDGDLWDIWQSPDLLFAQTCGLPFNIALRDHTQLIGAPDFALPDCPPGHYYSQIITRTSETRDPATLLATRPVINETRSQSGHAALWAYAQRIDAPLTTPLHSGGHRLSARMVADGRADIAAIDANTWRMIQRWDSFASDLQVIDRTPPTPAMPFICAATVDGDALQKATQNALVTLPAQTKDTLGLYGIVPASPDDFAALHLPPDYTKCA